MFDHIVKVLLSLATPALLLDNIGCFEAAFSKRFSAFGLGLRISWNARRSTIPGDHHSLPLGRSAADDSL